MGKAASAKGSALSPGVTAGVRSYLTFLRNHSAYGALRLVINICWALLTTCAVAALLFGTIGVCISGNDVGLGGVGLAIGAIVLLSVGAIVLLIAVRQSVMLLIDIADTLLLEHSKGGTPTL
jgi:hypothetical protein